MVCEHCGSVVPEGAVVCPQCGFQVSAVQRYKGQAARRQGRPEKQKNDHGDQPYLVERFVEKPDLSGNRQTGFQ